ncbi:MAG: phosphate transport system regulatory protein PhoU [Lentisphaerae bacterium RIFOXYB12_FULL_65_16]|nr:MAG: phosphate transport system regulatory protein PhoU [Lentisphaerae bacterium RIFOXYA12_64_32]OGV93361.1 MAG: phosphate transport system regulatory protein PhoU [Lentisphaerae bacterium RIFOXYB12_FULL_65_16]
MSKILQNEIRRLEWQMLSLSGVAEDMIYRAVKAVETRDRRLGEEVIASDSEIDRMEVELEEEGLKILALHHPVAVDLRFIVAVIKINSDLERLGDLATTIAKQAVILSDRPEIPQPFDLHQMARKAWTEVRTSLDALVHLDVAVARQVPEMDREIDALHKTNGGLIERGIRDKPDATASLLAFWAVSRSLERVADHAKSIAADVIYMVEGEIVRHNRKPEHPAGPWPSGAADAAARTEGPTTGPKAS